jgi:hypothetical protein
MLFCTYSEFYIARCPRLRQRLFLGMDHVVRFVKQFLGFFETSVELVDTASCIKFPKLSLTLTIVSQNVPLVIHQMVVGQVR